LYQHSGVALQINPTYYEFRLWLFTEYGNVGVDLNASKASEIMKALSISKLLISNVPGTVKRRSESVTRASHLTVKSEKSDREMWISPSVSRPAVRYTRGERAYLTRQVNKYLMRKRKANVDKERK
jgi:hypothetical protein